VIRVGGTYTVYWHAYRYVRRHLAEWPDLIIEEVNTIPFFSRLYLPGKPRLMVFYMLCREIWFFQLPLPFSLIGYLLEPLYLRLVNRDPAVTISQSTRRDLGRHGFPDERVSVMVPGIGLRPVDRLATDGKFEHPTVVSMGSIRPMKRTLHQIQAYERARDRMPNLRLKIAGQASGRYGNKVLAAIASSRHRDGIEYLGRISEDEKRRLLSRSHLILVTSIKEGWGLIVTEAASQGTPAAVYDVDGLRDSVRDGQTGLVTAANPEALSAAIVRLLIDPGLYEQLRKNAWRWSQEITFDHAYRGLQAALDELPVRSQA
jgi:glycosyltransferase involved in cell wall biosynthesis